MQPSGFDIPAYKDSISFTDYKLRVGDRLFVRVYSTDDKTNDVFNGTVNNTVSIILNGSSNGAIDLYTYLIDDSGNLNFPMVGDVHVEGLTLREANDALEKAIKPVLKFSTVEIRVVGRYFSVLGSGKSAYINLPQEKINIFKALAMAGDVGIYGDRSRIRVLRETDKGVLVKKFDLRSADIIHSEFFYIEPNDVIYIQNINEQFFSITNLTSFLSTALTTVSFGALIYDSYDKIVNSTGTK
ncbi:MAG: polysaccharide biosynthesis/export family protein [Paludibacter sp.]|nr:polysaccharide biosynthesis/export family protein [Paludibacter sp.]